MIALYILIIVFFIWYSNKDFSRSVLLFAAVHILFNAGMAIRFQPPAITIDLVLNMYFIFMYYTKYKFMYNTNDNAFFKKPFIWMLVSLIISIVIAILDGNISALTMGIRILLSQYIFIFVFWHVCNSKENLHYFSKCIIWVFAIVFVYGLFEFFTNTNPFLDLIRSHIPNAYAENKIYLSDLHDLQRGGRARLQSLFYITIMYGICSVLFVFYLFSAYKNQKELTISKYTVILLSILGIFACYLSNSKTPIVVLPCFFFPYLFKNKYSIIAWIIIFILLIQPDLFNNLIEKLIDVDSLDINNEDASTGSTAAMRLRQFEISKQAFLNAPIFGNGLRYSSYLATTIEGHDLLGAESCWFKLLIEQGLFGIIAFIYIIANFIVSGFKISKGDAKSLAFFALGFFIIVSITDIGYELFYVLYIALYRMYSLNINNDESSNDSILNSNLSKQTF